MNTWMAVFSILLDGMQHCYSDPVTYLTMHVISPQPCEYCD